MKTKKLMISENHFRFLFESDDNSEAKIKQLLDSGQKENIEFAFMLMDSQNLNKTMILKDYQELFQFLKKCGIFVSENLHQNILFKMVNLTKLNLQRKNISILPNSLYLLKNLEMLDLSYNNIETLPDSFGNLTNLVTLQLNGNLLNSLPESFGNLNSLQFLNLIDNDLTLLPNSFKLLSKLSSLFVKGNLIADEYVDDLLRSMPKLKIYLN